jgi:AraC-like DNA-binding protein
LFPPTLNISCEKKRPAVKNAYFSGSDTALLLDCGGWSVVSAGVSSLAPVRPDRRYAEWVNQNVHSHPHREIMFDFTGGLFFSLAGQTYKSRPGTIFLIGPDERHDYFYPSFYRDIKHLWFSVVNKKIITRGPWTVLKGKKIGGRQFMFSSAQFDYSGMAFLKAWDDLLAGGAIDDEFRILCVKYAFANLAAELCREGFERAAGAPPPGTERAHKDRIDAIAGHIRETGGKNLDTAKLAFIAGYSKFHFARIFKKHTGLSVLGFVNMARNERFRELSASGMSKKQISYELGFSCPAAFSRWLRNRSAER